MNDPVIIKAAACVPVDVLLCTLLVFLVLLLQVFTCLSDIWPRASSCWANAGTFAVALIKNVLFVLSVFQATLTSSEDGSTGNLTLLTWTLWRATLATSAWISSAAETGDSESEDLFVFLQWSSLFFCLFGFFWSKDIFIFGERFKGDESVSFESVYLSFIDTQIKYTFFSGKPSCIPSDLAPPVQLYSYLFCTFLSQ